jgi:hypothetical protein
MTLDVFVLLLWSLLMLFWISFIIGTGLIISLPAHGTCICFSSRLLVVYLSGSERMDTEEGIFSEVNLANAS